MRRWLEVVLLLAVVAVGMRFGLPSAGRAQPAKVEERADPLGGYRIVGAEPGNNRRGSTLFLETPDGSMHLSGTHLIRNAVPVLATGDSRETVIRALGEPVAFKSDNSKWGYWTRNLPNPKMGILIFFGSGPSVRRIELHTDWSRLAADLAR